MITRKSSPLNFRFATSAISPSIPPPFFARFSSKWLKHCISLFPFALSTISVIFLSKQRNTTTASDCGRLSCPGYFISGAKAPSNDPLRDV